MTSSSWWRLKITRRRRGQRARLGGVALLRRQAGVWTGDYFWTVVLIGIIWGVAGFWWR